MKSHLLASAARELVETAAGAGWRGADPYDALWYQWPELLAGGRRRRQGILQLHARAPWDLRRFRRSSPPRIPKALALFGSAALRVARLRDDTRMRQIALGALEALAADTGAGADAWGYPWDVQMRWSFYPAGTPNIVATAFAASALAEAGVELGRPEFVARAKRATEWIRDELFNEPAGHFVYHPLAEVNIHNANLLGCWVLHRVLPDDPAARERVRRAVDRTLIAQHADGSWAYGDGDSLGWADSFHTGYVLSSLARLGEVDSRIPGALARGTGYYERFFDARGRARLWAHRAWPEDAHSAGTALTTLARLAESGQGRRELLERVAARTLAAGVRRGRAIHRRYGPMRTTVRYIRWADAHVALGLADAALHLAGVEFDTPEGLARAAAAAAPADPAVPDGPR